MSSYMAYKVSTKTNVNYFKKSEMCVDRRFSDFLGLHDKLSEKYLQNGRIIPPAPDKSVVGMTKVKMSKEGNGDSAAHQDEVKTYTFAKGHSCRIWVQVAWEKCKTWAQYFYISRKVRGCYHIAKECLYLSFLYLYSQS